MASIYKRKDKEGKSSGWRAVVRIKGYPTVCDTFERKQEADDWAQDAERKIKLGQYNFTANKQQYTYAELIERLHLDNVLQRHRSFKNIRSQFQYWKERLGSYALAHINSELLAKERNYLIDLPTKQGKKRTPGTINRYMAVLSSTLSYATKRLRWMHENPCTNLLRVEDNAGRDRILNAEEIARLLAACKQSKSPYLYCIVLTALTTGARRGEILGLEWRHLDLEKRIANLKETKNGRPRSVALADPVIEELKKIYAMRQLNKPLVFASRTAFGRVDIKKAWAEAIRRGGISDYHFHDLRHQFCTFVAGMGASNLELATAMGHRTLQMLVKYTHLDTNITEKFSKNISERILSSSLSEV